MFTRMCLICISILSFGFAQTVFATGSTIQAGIGIGLIPDGDYTMSRAGYEGSISKSTTLGGRVYSFDYDLEENDSFNYIEEGSGSGVEAVFRFYPRKNTLHGLYLGAALGLATLDWTWSENASPSSTTRIVGTGESTLLSIGFVIGAKFHFGNSAFYIEPSFYLPYYLAIDVTTSDGEDEIELSVAPSVGVTLGMTF